MRLSTIWHLARKEILSTFRDRRALLSNIAIPLVLMPVMMLGMPMLLGGIFESEAVNVTPVAVEGGAELPVELRTLLESGLMELVEVDDAETAVREGDQDTGLTVPPGFAETLADGSGTADLTIHTLVGNMQSELATSKLSAALGIYRDMLVQGRLTAAGLDPSLLEPIAVQTVDASSEQARSSGMFGWLIPFFIALWSLIGGQMTAVDATAGEKERGTMESLLVSPVSRFEVVIGKWLATLLFGLMATGAAIAGYLLGSVLAQSFGSGESTSSDIKMMMGGSLNLSFGGTLELVVSSVLLTAFISALLIFVSTFARSFKEAQSYLGPLSFVMVIPAVAMQFRDFFDLGLVQYVIPVLNAIIVMYDTVRGATVPLGLAVTWLSLLVFTAVLLMLAHRSFKREDVIFRT